ncbi:MAG: hypothetical protein V4772_28060 [Pseudomonadota bacterium]
MTADHTSIEHPDDHAHSAQLAYWFYLAFVLMALAASAVLVEAQAAPQQNAAASKIITMPTI